ncbi:MAG: porin [Methylococcaceae bacterium]
MKFSKLTLAIAAALGASLSSQAFAIDLYVDKKTKQIYAEPGSHRERMGSFERVEDQPQKHEDSTSSNKNETEAEIKGIKEDLEYKTNELKALEEHVVYNREEKSKNDEKWFNKINLRGYTQLRYNQPLSGDSGAAASKNSPELRSPGDSGIKDNGNFSFRRVRLVFSGDINDYLYLYIQPDFASSVSDTQQNFAQLRDAYGDLSFDKKHEYRIRAGQSKVPFSWENLQSSQNRLALDRADAINSAVPSERDLGLFAYWTPEPVQKLWKSMSKKGLKTSGDYGILGVGVYNGQGLNRAEVNDDMYFVAHSTYPLELNFLGYPFTGQVLEVGADYMNGKFNTTTGDIKPFGGTKTILKTDLDKTFTPYGQKEERVAVHAILFPQPFGLQAEWNWGTSPTLNTEGKGSIRGESLGGGYVQAMYKIDNVFREDGSLMPYVKWQTYNGAYKGATNAPRSRVDEWEVGVEYQIMKAIEVTMAYSDMKRTNNSNLGLASGDLLRMQLQWNY